MLKKTPFNGIITLLFLFRGAKTMIDPIDYDHINENEFDVILDSVTDTTCD